MELKDKIREIISVVYSFGSNERENKIKVLDVATDRIMEVIEEEKKDKDAI